MIRVGRLKQLSTLFFILLICNLILSIPGMIKYTIIPVFLIGMGVTNRQKINISRFKELFAPSLNYIIFGIVFCFINLFFSFESLKIILLLVISFTVFVLIVELLPYSVEDIIKCQFLSTMFIYVFVDRLGDESQYAFSFGLFILFYVFNMRDDNRKLAIISIAIAVVLSSFFMGKRLALLLTLLLMCMGLILRLRKKIYIKRIYLVFLLFLLYIFSLIYLYLCKHNIFDYIKTNYGILVSGREYILSLFNPYYEISPLFLGHGLGWAFNKMASYNIAAAGNLHNDLLQVYLDTGFIGFSIFFWSFNKWFKRRDKTHVGVFLAIIYTVGNYLTDNVLIYINYWIVLYLVIYYFRSIQEER